MHLGNLDLANIYINRLVHIAAAWWVWPNEQEGLEAEDQGLSENKQDN